jgi:hypothetical protein
MSCDTARIDLNFGRMVSDDNARCEICCSYEQAFADTTYWQIGTDIMILEIFSQKQIAKKMAFLTQNKAKLCKFLIITLDFEKNANFSLKIGKKR